MRTPQPKTSLDYFSPHVSQFVEGPIKVRALQKGFYGNTRRNPGDVFGIQKMEEFGDWMELVSDTPEQGEPEPAEAEHPRGKKPSKRKADDDVL